MGLIARSKLYFSISIGFLALKMARDTKAKVVKAAALAVLMAKLTPGEIDDGIAAQAVAATKDEQMLNALVVLIERSSELQSGWPIESEAAFNELHGDNLAAFGAAGMSPIVVLMIINLILQILRDRRAQ